MPPEPFEVLSLPSIVKFARIVDFGCYQSNGYNPSPVCSIITIEIEHFIKSINNWMPIEGVDKSGRKIEFLNSSKEIVCSTYICSRFALSHLKDKSIRPVITWGQ